MGQSRRIFDYSAKVRKPKKAGRFHCILDPRPGGIRINANLPRGRRTGGSCAICADLAEKDPQLKHRKFLFAFDELHKDFGQTFGDKLPIKFDKTPCESYLRSRSLGEDNDEVLVDWLDLAPEEIQKNKSEGWLT